MKKNTSHKQTLIIFAKTPELGRVKTRMIPALGIEGACELHKRLVTFMVDGLSRSEEWECELHVSGDINHTFIKELKNKYPITLQLQQGENLGNKMFNALNSALTAESHKAVIVGGDCASVTPEYLRAAFEALSNHKVVMGPSNDGGYVLVGQKGLATSELFNTVDWGTESVLEQSLINIETMQASCKLLEEAWDIDEPEELIKLDALVTIDHNGIEHCAVPYKDLLLS